MDERTVAATTPEYEGLLTTLQAFQEKLQEVSPGTVRAPRGRHHSCAVKRALQMYAGWHCRDTLSCEGCRPVAKIRHALDLMETERRRVNA